MTSNLAIKLSQVSKRYPHFNLSKINLALEEGCIMGLIGPNGAGKSTTIRLLMGLVQPDAGEVSVLGHSMPSSQVKAKWEIGFASEDMRLYKNATIEWHMEYLQSIYPSWDKGYAETLLKRFDLIPRQKIKGLSHGQRVKAGLLLVLARRPKLLILDEPTTGLDPVARHEVLNELMEVLKDETRSVLFSSHNTQDVEQLSDQITFIDRGKVVNSQDRETFLERWQRIRLDLSKSDWSENNLSSSQPGVVDIQQSGNLAVVTTNQFNPDMVSAYQQQGAEILGVENMTLEEIFVAEVHSSRQGAEK
ncbi:ABC transporter ATP-binding protein [Aliikangiella coralliicola]|uniref:ABC transporter ATP-binding protein n=1 Tax=Aliikangiella coralliicola TaxID=2592383 RepID=A0A545UBU4_9GAMM|nr:ABC transporter ATP-binding protein [Aliikangiella coralliicola]TQV86936.1 ABC transporter ATP-binding protein [Aliikangiella coralliicola]